MPGGEGSGMLNWERNFIKPGHHFPRHAHAQWSIAVVFAGVGFVSVGGRWHEAWPGSITVLHPGEPHISSVHPVEGLDYLVIAVTEEEACRLHGHGSRPRFARHVIYDAECAMALTAACRDAMPGSRCREADPAAIRAAIARLLDRYARGDGTPSRPSAAIRTLRDYLDDHYSAALSLRDMASIARVSPATLMRHFTAEMGMPPHEYLVSRRIDAARSLVMAGRPLPEVAHLTGFADQSHLHRHFTRIVGVTPGRYRRQRLTTA
jgi:AraC-like DNA-binding protein